MDHIQPAESGFLVEFADGSATAKTILLATGVVNHRPDMRIDLHREAVARGLIRYCPICDGFEAMNQKIAVLGADDHGVDEALFLRTYSANITLLCAREIASAKMQRFAEAGIEIVTRPVTSIAIDQTRIVVDVERSTTGFAFDTLYPALGSSSNIELATRMGAAVSDQGCLIVDDHQMTTCAGVYAAGDVVEGLDQISVAAGQAAIAATAIHNRLRSLEGR